MAYLDWRLPGTYPIPAIDVTEAFADRGVPGHLATVFVSSMLTRVMSYVCIIEQLQDPGRISI